jgi:2-(3-amino-3-carboxypropyl)histidine synthase
MEEDREQTNLGPEVPLKPDEEPLPAQRQPKKRFIGRKAAEQKAAARAEGRSIEGSGAIQRMQLISWNINLDSHRFSF